MSKREICTKFWYEIWEIIHTYVHMGLNWLGTGLNCCYASLS